MERWRCPVGCRENGEMEVSSGVDGGWRDGGVQWGGGRMERWRCPVGWREDGDMEVLSGAEGGWRDGGFE